MVEPIEELGNGSLRGISGEAWPEEQFLVSFKWRHGGAL